MAESLGLMHSTRFLSERKGVGGIESIETIMDEKISNAKTQLQADLKAWVNTIQFITYKISSVHAGVKDIRSRINQMKADIERIDSEIVEVRKEILESFEILGPNFIFLLSNR